MTLQGDKWDIHFLIVTTKLQQFSESTHFIL